MASPWDDILEKLEKLERDLDSIGKLASSISSEMELYYGALEQVRADLNKTKKQAATLRALSPYQRYARAG
jgi:hypothetical protein